MLEGSSPSPLFPVTGVEAGSDVLLEVLDSSDDDFGSGDLDGSAEDGSLGTTALNEVETTVSAGTVCTGFPLTSSKVMAALVLVNSMGLNGVTITPAEFTTAEGVDCGVVELVVGNDDRGEVLERDEETEDRRVVGSNDDEVEAADLVAVELENGG